MCPAQQSEQRYIDSLSQLLHGAKEDTVRVALLYELSGAYHTVDPERGIRYGEQALELAIDLNWRNGIAEAYNTLGLNYQYMSQYPRASEYDFKALKIYEDRGDNESQAKMLRRIATIYQYEKNYDKVKEYNEKTLRIYEETGDKKGLSGTLSNIGIFYFFEGKYDSALIYDFKALQICEEMNTPGSVASNLQNIGDTYMHMKDYSRSLAFAFRAQKLFEQLGDKYGIAIGLGNIGETYLAIAKDTSGKTAPDSLVSAGKNENLRKAIEYLTASIAASREIEQLDNIIEFSEYLSNAYEAAGDYKKALESYREYTRMNDSVYSASNTLKIKQSDHIHDLELRDKDIQLARLGIAKRRNERILFVAASALLIVIIVVIYRNFKTEKRANRALFKSNRLLGEEKKRSDDLLLNILPEEVASDLKKTGRAATRHFENVTVLFTDFVNFTEAGERLTPEELIEELHTCFKAFDEIIEHHNIEKIKTIGDAYLAVAGLPIANPKHAQAAVDAAREIRDFMLNRRAEMGDRTFEVRIGIHSGSVVAGIVGVKKFAYDIWGDAVNTAARMEQSSEPGKINISQKTYELVKDQFSCAYRGEIEAKNKGMLRMYFVS